MITPSWRRVKWVKVPAKPDGPWSLAVDQITGPRLIRISVSNKDEQGAEVPTKWKPSSAEECGGNGMAKAAPDGLVPSAPYGALVGKLGGSSADLTETPATSGRKFFPVGTYCVLNVSATEGGPLYLTMNDKLGDFANHSGELMVLIEEAPQ
jgi:hypothetical protein